MSVNTLVPWVQTDAVALPANAQPPDIARRAALLNPRDQTALVMAFDTGAYEMAATFVWSKAIAALKKQLAGLGMEFVGEMLGSGRLVAAAGLRRALMRVNGFDFVPETLRSETFRAAARAVLGAHLAWDNFYNEPKPMEALARRTAAGYRERIMQEA
jgi:hypothetical protein